jgi:hypothetical protein
LVGNLQAYQKFEVEIFNLRKPSELEVRKQCHIKFSNRVAALENCSYSEKVGRGWQNLKGKSGTSATASLGQCELQQHKPCFIEEFLHYFYQRNLAKMV